MFQEFLPDANDGGLDAANRGDYRKVYRRIEVLLLLHVLYELMLSYAALQCLYVSAAQGKGEEGYSK